MIIVATSERMLITFGEIDHEIISTAILLPFTDSIKIVVSYKRKYSKSCISSYTRIVRTP